MTPSSVLGLPRSAFFAFCGALALAVMFVHGGVVGHEFVQWDDGLLITDNPIVRGMTPSNIAGAFTTYDPELYIPLTIISYQIDYLIGGTNPAMYHLTNLLLHAANTALVGALLLLLLKRNGRSAPVIALFGGLLFGLHPLNAEAVAWASARKDLLSGFFALIAAIAFFREGRGWLIASIVAFTLALLAKSSVMGLPFALAALAWARGERLDARMLRRIAPYVVLSTVFAIIALGGKTGVFAESSLGEKLLMIPAGAVFLLGKFVWPWPLSVLYPFTGPVSLSSPAVAGSILVLAAVAVAVAGSLRRTRAVAAGVFWFAVLLAPGLLNAFKGGYVYMPADRYAYIAGIGLLWMLTMGMHAVMERDEGRARGMRVPAAIVLAAFALLSLRQNRVWKDSVTLFRHAVLHYPASAVAHNNLANHLSRQQREKGDIDRAVDMYLEAIRLAKLYGRPSAARDQTISKIFSNLSSAERERGNIASALSYADIALEHDPKNPYATLGKGVISASAGNFQEAEHLYLRTLEIQPGFVAAYVNLGSLYNAMERTGEAIEALQNAIALDPYAAQAHFNLGVVLAKVRRMGESFAAYQRAVELAPNFVAARINLGIQLLERRRYDEAREQFEAVLALDPKNAQARSVLNQL